MTPIQTNAGQPSQPSAPANDGAPAGGGTRYAELDIVIPGFKPPPGFMPRPRPARQTPPPPKEHKKGLVRRFHDLCHIHEEKHKRNDERRRQEYQAELRAFNERYDRELKRWENEQLLCAAAQQPQEVHAQVPIAPVDPPKSEIETKVETMQIAMKKREVQRQAALKAIAEGRKARNDAFENMGKAQSAGDEAMASFHADDVMAADDDINRARDVAEDAQKYFRLMKKTLSEYEKYSLSVHDRKLLSDIGKDVARLADEEHLTTLQADGNVELDDEFFNKDMSREERRAKLLDQAGEWAAPREAVIVKPTPVVQQQTAPVALAS